MCKSLDSGGRLDHSSFLKNTTIRPVGDRGRGLYATRAIQTDEIVFCEKAFGISFQSDDNNNNGPCTLVNAIDKCVAIGCQAALLPRLVEKLQRTPSNAFFDFHPRLPASSDEDLWSRRRHSSGGCLPRAVHPGSKRLCFARRSIPQKTQAASAPAGVWIHTSYMNHACNGNAFQAFLGDMMIVRAVTPIAAGEEILICYKMIECTADDIGATFAHWRFRCRCVICTAEQDPLGSPAARRQLLRDAHAFIKFASSPPTPAQHAWY